MVWTGRDADLGSFRTSLRQQRVEEFCAMIEGPSVMLHNEMSAKSVALARRRSGCQ